MIYGTDDLFGACYQKVMIDTHPEGWAGGIFWSTPKLPDQPDARKAVMAIGKSGKWSELVVHLAPFDKTHRYDLQANLPIVYSACSYMFRVARRYTNTKFILSPFCESQHSKETMIPIFKEMKTRAPNCSFVHSVYG